MTVKLGSVGVGENVISRTANRRVDRHERVSPIIPGDLAAHPDLFIVAKRLKT